MIVRLLTRPASTGAAFLLLVGVAIPTLTSASGLLSSADYPTAKPATGALAPSEAIPPEKLSWYGDTSAPDISGVWVLADAPATSGSREGWQPWAPPLKPAFAEIWKKRVADTQADKRTDDPVRGCLPPGMPRFITGTNGPMLIVQTKGRVMLYRDGIPVRRIWLNAAAQPAPKDLESFSNGNAIGHYADEDLVTEVVGIKDQPIDSTGVPHSEDLKIVERYHRVDATTLQVKVTLTDPTAYTRPLTSSVTYRLLNDPAWEPQEFLCTPVTNYHPEKYVH